MKGISAAEVARHFVRSWVFNYGPPEDLIADNGGCFTSKYFQDVCRIMNVHNSFTTTYHPQTNGQVERYNRTILAALRTYVADHPRDWDLYTDALKYAYNCLPHTSTSSPPFDLVLSKPPGPIAIEPVPSKVTRPKAFKEKWKRWLQDTLSNAKKRLDSAQARAKRNYDRRLRKQKETIQEGDFVYLRVERKNAADHRHKLAPVAEGPFRVTKTTGNTVVIERADRSVERVSRSRVVLAPKPLTEAEMEQTLQPTLVDNTLEYPTSADTNRLDITKPTSDTNVSSETRQAAAATNGQEIQSPPTVKDQNNQTNDGTTEFVIDKIVEHQVNKSRRHRYAKHGETLYRVRWHGFDIEDDTWEPVKHLPRSKVLTYCKAKGLEPPPNLGDSIDG